MDRIPTRFGKDSKFYKLDSKNSSFGEFELKRFEELVLTRLKHLKKGLGLDVSQGFQGLGIDSHSMVVEHGLTQK